MAATQATLLDGEVDVSTEVVGLTEFAPQAWLILSPELNLSTGAGSSSMYLLQCCLPHLVINVGIYSPAVLVTGTFASDAVTIGPMLRQKEPTILNGSEVRMGTIQFYAENAEMCYRAWPDATRLAFVTSRERLLQFCIDHLDKAPYLPSNGIVTIEPKSPESDDCNRGARFAL